LDLKSAVVEIRQALDQNMRRAIPSPFFFMVGAGISHPPLPLAAKIQEDCKAEALKYGKTAPPPSPAPIDSYSYWFERAYPHPENRQQVLRDLMEKAVISRANFRLAHLLLDKTVTNLVVTPNFDDFLSRALTLFGLRHIVCDHPRTLERIDFRSTEVQIIHVHGSYWFYDCCNLRAEIATRAEWSSSTSFTMLSALDEILKTHSPLVVGYSGWEGDVFMNALQRRLTTGLRTKLYWFCYRRRDGESLPPPSRTEFLLESFRNAIRQSKHREAIGFASGIRLGDLTAEQLRELSIALANAGPALDDNSDDELNCYDLVVTLADRLEVLGQDDLSIWVRLARSLYNKGVTLGMLNRSEDEIAAYDEVVRRFGDDTEPALREQVAKALYNKGFRLGALNRSEDAITAYDEVVRRFGDDTEPALREQVAKALYNKGARLGALNRSGDEIAAYDEVVRRFGDATEPALREQVAKALLNRGARLGALNRSEDAIAAYDEVMRRFGDATEPALREQVEKAAAARKALG
jgi:tetratricopeptide (TPR) repeat protein